MRGFASLARLTYKALVEEINGRKEELFNEIDSLSVEIAKKLKEHLRARGNIPEDASIRVYFYPRSARVKPMATITVEFKADPHEVAPEEVERLEGLLKELDRMSKLLEKLRLTVESWKARAIKNKTYFDEPFPAEYYDLLPEELKKTLRRDEE